MASTTLSIRPMGEPPSLGIETLGMCFSPDGDKIALAGRPLSIWLDLLQCWPFNLDVGRSRILLFELESGKMIKRFHVPYFRECCILEFLEEGGVLKCANSKSITYWDLEAGSEIRERREVAQGLVSVDEISRTYEVFDFRTRVMSSDRSFIAWVGGVWGADARGEMNKVSVMSDSMGQRHLQVEGLTHGLNLTPDGRYLIATCTFGEYDGDPLSTVATDSLSSDDGLGFQIWDTQTLKMTRKLVLVGRDEISAVAFSPDGRLLVGRGKPLAGYTYRDERREGLVEVWDMHEGTCMATLHTGVSWISALGVSSDGKKIGVGGKDTALVYCMPRNK